MFTLIDVPAEGRYNDLIIWFLNMAIFSAKASFCSRSSGKGAVAQAAYRSGKAFKDNQRGRTFDYSKKTDRHDIHQNILLPIGAPEWMKNSEKLWNHVQEFETNLIFKRYSADHKDPVKREQSLAGREKALNSAQDSWNQIIALPRELTKEQNVEMLEIYLRERFSSRGLISDYSIHMDKGNWHAHVAVTLREMLPTGNFSEKKITSYRGDEAHKNIFNRDGLIETRRILADTMNNSLERAGVLDRVDHRSLEEQGIKRQATIHEGSYARILESTGGKARLCEINRDRKAQNLALYLENPAYLLNDLARQSVVFTEAKIAETIFKLTDGDENVYQDLSAKVKAVRIPETSRQVVKGGFQYKSDALIEHFDAIFAEQERTSLAVEVTDFVKAGEGVAQSYLEKESALLEFKKVGLSNHLIKTTGRERDDLLAGFISNPASLVEVLAKEKIVFREKDVENTLLGLVSESEACYRVLESYGEGRQYPKDIEIANQTVNFAHDDVKADVEYWIQGLTKEVLSSSNSIELGRDVGREKVFTSATQQEKEGQTLERVQRLSQNKTAFKVKEGRAEKVINAFEAQEQKALATKAPEAVFKYSDEQRDAIADLLSAGQLKILKGRAGTGKSTVLKPLVAVLKDQGYDVIGMASYGKVSEAMEGDLGINARTIDSLRLSWKEYDNSKEILSSGRFLTDKDRNKHLKIVRNLEKDQITSKKAVILDEGSLVSHEHYELIFSKVEKAGSKLIIVKDDSQIKTLFGADISEAMDRYVEGKSLIQVQRQRAPWMKEASIALNSHKIEEGLLAYEERGCIKYLETHEEAKAAFIESYVRDFDPSKTLLGMTFLNKDVRDLNLGIFDSLREKGHLGETFVLNNTDLAVGATVAFSTNDKRVKTVEANGSTNQGVKNGSFGVIESYNKQTHEIQVRLANDGRLVSLNAKTGYDDLTLGYVITSTKAQCLTFDGAKLLCSRHDDAGSTVVNCTRHKDSLEIFSPGEVATDVRGLAKVVGTSSYRGTTLDYSVNEEERPFLEMVSLYKEARIEFAQSLEKLTAYKEDYQAVLLEGGAPQEEQHKAALAIFNKESYNLKERRNKLAEKLLENWQECSTFCRQASISEETLSKESGKTQGLFTTLEHKRFERIEQYIDVAQETRRLWEVVSTDTPSALIHSHPLYNEYLQVKTKRNALAVDMALAPKSYKPLFTVSSFYGEGVEPIGYTLLNGRSYEKKPPAFESCLNHALEATPDLIVFEASEDGKVQSRLYETLKEYKVLKSRSNQAYHNLQDDLFKTESVVKDLNSVMASTAKDRDTKAALALSLMDQLSYSQSAPILAHLGFDEKAEKLFYEHVGLEEMRFMLAQHKTVADISERLGLSQDLHEKLFPEGVCDKKAFAQFKGMGGDPQRLIFEQGYAKHLESGGDVLYASPSDLEDAYHCLSNYKKSHAESVKNWQIIKGDIKARVETLHLSQIESLTSAGHFLSYEELKKEAFEALKFNVGNNNAPNWKVNDEKVLSYVSGELKRAVSSVTISKGSDSAVDIRSQHRQLQIMQTVLDGGRRELANYHEVMADGQASRDYIFAENSKKMWARDLVDNKALSVIEGAFGEGFARQVTRDAQEEQGKVLVEAFRQASGLKKADFAGQILSDLEVQKETNSYVLRNHLRQAGIYENNMDLQLYSLLDKASVGQEEKEELSRLVDEYVQKSTKGIELWQGDLDKAKTNMADVSQAYTSGLLSLKEQFETMSPHKRLRYDGENLVKFVLSTAKEAGISVEEQLKAQDHSAVDILNGKSHKVYRPVRETVFAEVSRLNEEKHWALSDEQIETFVTGILNVSVEKQVLDVELYQSKESTRNYELKDALAEASYRLVESSLGTALKEREEKWAQKMITVHEHKKHAKELIASFHSGSVLEKARLAVQMNDEMAGEWSPQQGILKTELNNNKLYGAGIERSMYAVLGQNLDEIDKFGGHKDLSLVQSYEYAYRNFATAWAETREQGVLLLGEEAKYSYEQAQSRLDKVYEGFIKENVKQNTRGSIDLDLPNESAETPISFRESVARAKEMADSLEKGITEMQGNSNEGTSSKSKTTLDSYNISALVGFTNRKADDIESSSKKDIDREAIYESLYLDVREKVSDLNQKKGLGLFGKQVGVVTEHILSLSHKYHDYDLKVKAATNDYWKENPEVEKEFWECLNAKKEAAIELVKTPLGLLLQDEDGKWSQDLKKAYKTVILGQKIEEYKELLEESRGNKELYADQIEKVYGELREFVYGKDGESFNKKAYQVICKDNKIYFETPSVVKNIESQAVPSETVDDYKNFKNVSGSYSHLETQVVQQLQRTPLYEFNYFLKNIRPSEVGEYVGKQFRSHSFVIEVFGQNTGKWYNTETKTRGDNLLDLIISETGRTVFEGIEEVAEYCNDVGNSLEILREYEESKQREVERQESRALEVEKKVKDLHTLVSKAEPIEGTLAESYLRNERGIQGELSDSLKYLPAGTVFSYNGYENKIFAGAMASIAKDLDGDVKAVQVTYLTEEGTRAYNNEGEKLPKKSFGSVTGAFVELQKGDEKSPIILAEGVETALSVKEIGIEGSVYCSLGTSNINNLDVTERNVIIAGDWDGSQDKPSWGLTENAKTTLEQKGNIVSIIYPVERAKLSEELTPEKVDFNDLLKTKGVESIMARVSEQVPVEIARELSHRENQKEKSNEQTQVINSNKESIDLPKPNSSASLSQDKEKPVEKVGEKTVSQPIEDKKSVKDDPYGGLTVFEYAKKQMVENPVQKKEPDVKQDPYGGLTVFEYAKKQMAENPVQKKEPDVKQDPYGGLTVFEYAKKQMAENPVHKKEPAVEKDNIAENYFREALNIKNSEKSKDTSKSVTSDKEKSRADDGWGMER